MNSKFTEFEKYASYSDYLVPINVFDRPYIGETVDRSVNPLMLDWKEGDK